MSVSITNVINATVSTSTQGLSVANINSLAFYTTETPSNFDPYRIYLNASDVKSDFGSLSETSAMADVIFGQSPNILSGNGRLVIIPLQSATSATSGNAETDDITANLANIIAVSDGDIRIVLNGTNIDLTNLDFTNATTYADVADILQSKLVDAVVDNVSTTGFKITSKKVGASSTLDIVQLPGGSGTDLSVASLFNVASLTLTVGTNAAGETIDAAITRIGDSIDYTGIISNLEMEDSVVLSLATSIQSTRFIYVHAIKSTEDFVGIADVIKDASQTRTRIIGVNDSPYFSGGYAGRMFSTNFSGTNTTLTSHLKTITSIIPNSAINNTIYTQGITSGVDMYVVIGGLSRILASGENAFFDSIYNQTWYINAIEVAGFNYLDSTNSKIPQTEIGMNGLKNAYKNICDQGVRNGFIGTGLQWNSSETFGNPDDLRRNITDNGFFIYSTPIALQSQVDRNARKAPLVQIAIKEAGAIHTSTVINIIEA